MKIAVASGKGGTGKTLVSTNLFNVLKNAQYLDCDVEEPNGHLFLKPKIFNRIVVSIPVPEIDESKCNYCGKCAEVCQFNALLVAKEKVLFFPELCHGCGSCHHFCPQKAITEKKRTTGSIEIGTCEDKKVATGRLNIGEPMAPPVIKQLKKASIEKDTLVILDAPPGTSCPVVETLKGVDFVVLVTEPTPFGLNDLKIAVEVVRKLSIPMGIVVNKAGLGGTIISDYCIAEQIPLLLEIQHSNDIAVAYSKAELITKDKKYKEIFQVLFQKITAELKQ